MCGIFGVYQIDGNRIDLGDLERAVTLMKHRGPDDEGYALFNTSDCSAISCGGVDTDKRLQLPHLGVYKDRPFNLAFGFRRLSIIDLSPGGHQPMHSTDGRHWIMLNGEVYNYLELRSELQHFGYKFHTSSDTEVVLAAYQHWGKECLSHFNGMWGLAIWDNHLKELFLARDRFGVKPIYYVQDENRIAFASEIKALVGKHGVPFQPDDTAIYYYLTQGVLPNASTGRTFFSNVHCLPPGHFMVISGRTTNVNRYWHLKPGEEKVITPIEEVVEEFRALFESAVRVRLRSDVAIGSCLSGGLDSSAIVTTIHRFLKDDGLDSKQIGDIQRTFSAVYNIEGPFNERKYVDLLLSKVSAMGNRIIPDSNRLLRDAEKLIWHQEEPFPSTSIFAQWCVMNLVSENDVTVLLDGQGLDELMGGYRPFAKYLADFIHRGQLRTAFRETAALYKTSGVDAWRYLLVALGYAFPLTSRLVFMLQEGIQADRKSLNPDFVEHGKRTVIPLRTAHPGSLDTHLRNIFEDTNLPNLLRYQDRNSMAFGLEAREPFLDYRLVEFSFGKAAPWRMHDGWTKYVLRRTMEPFVPPQITWRKDKVGYAVPEEIWLKEWMRSSEMDLFRDNSLSAEYLDMGIARSRIRHWLEHDGTQLPLWRWINLEMWLKAWQHG